jgi:hypothetical protein
VQGIGCGKRQHRARRGRSRARATGLPRGAACRPALTACPVRVRAAGCAGVLASRRACMLVVEMRAVVRGSTRVPSGRLRQLRAARQPGG